MKRAFVLLAVLFPFAISLNAQTTAVAHTLVVIPFENTSPTPGLEWIGESFPEAFHQQLNSPAMYVASREDRLRAYDRIGIPLTLHASRATLYRLAEQMDVDYVVLGSYRYDGAILTATAQVLDMRSPKLLVASSESGSLQQLGAIQSALAWDTLRQVRPDFALTKDRYIASLPTVRLDAFENFVQGLLASDSEEKIRRYREATRIYPAYSEAWLELGKTYFNQKAYDQAISTMAQIAPNSAVAREANFYLGLAAYYRGDYARAESAFAFVAARLPLAEVYNNLGVVNARRGHRDAIKYFQRAIENDPSDSDYHFNLAVMLSRSGDGAGAARELKTTLDRRAGDAEAKQMLDAIGTPGTGVVPANAVNRPIERIKRNYEENTFRQLTLQMQSWAELRYARADPKSHARFHVERGKDLLEHGFIDEAEKEFKEASGLDSSSPVALTGLAEVLDARGDGAGARAQAEAAMGIRESADAYLLLARLDLRENKVDAAARNVARAVQLEPQNQVAQELKRAVAAKLAEKQP